MLKVKLVTEINVAILWGHVKKWVVLGCPCLKESFSSISYIMISVWIDCSVNQ